MPKSSRTLSFAFLGQTMPDIKSGTVPPPFVSYKEKRPREYLVEHEVEEFVSGDQFPDINLSACDDYGQCNAHTVAKNLRATLEAPDLFDGTISADMAENGEGKIPGFRTKSADPGNYNVMISFGRECLDNIAIRVSVRDCRIGEMESEDGVRCKQCGDLEYSFHQDRKITEKWSCFRSSPIR